jgi:DmsE family decaheme c-type cytochrome
MKRKHLLLLLFPIAFLVLSVSFTLSSEKDLPAIDGKQGYVGAETCKGCHETQYASYAGTIHSKKAIKGPESQDACETCHGGGAKHVEKGGGRGVDIFDFGKKVDVKARSAKCLSCHEETRQMSSWNMSKHKIKGVACNDCHSAHSGKEKSLKEETPNLCYTCHRDVRSQSGKQSHHPIKEGLINCSSCHDVHGSFGNKQIKADTVNELCYKCHADKRGPYMWSHPPVEENCLTCHKPHGSNHSKLLTKRPPELCQSCHDWTQHPGSPYTSFDTFGAGHSNRLIARSCLNCHSQIHGSNGPSARGLHFVR